MRRFADDPIAITRHWRILIGKMGDIAFPNRLEQAIENLTPAQQKDLFARAPEARGLKAAIAHIAGLPSPNVLSDILAGRVPGTKYRSALAAAVSTELAWLEGLSDEAPDWAMSPVGAWRRFTRRLEEAAQRARLKRKSLGESTLPVAAGDVPNRLDAEVLARNLRLDPRDPALADLLNARFSKPPVAVVWSYAAHLGLAMSPHAEHLERGRELWRACEDEFATQLAQASAGLRRLLPPPAIFRLMRAALVGMRQAQPSEVEGTRIEDALEILWRQQWYLKSGSRHDVPAAFTEETGRRAWSRLRDIQARYAGDSDIDGRQRPRPAGPR